MKALSEIQLSASQLQAYFKRIGFEHSNLAPTPELLANLHEKHVFSIPFGNSAIFQEKEIKVDLPAIFDKLVIQKRDGYCYEMNTLFYAVLKTLNFNPQLNLAEVIYDAKPRSRPARHAIITLSLAGGNYLVDVGYGRNGLIKPLLLSSNSTTETIVYNSRFQTTDNESDGFLYRFHFKNTFNLEYRFDPLISGKEVTLETLVEHNDYVSKSSDSIFTQKFIITKPTKFGRITLNNDRFTIYEGNNKHEIILLNKQQFLQLLGDAFDLHFPDSGKLLQLPFEFAQPNGYGHFFQPILLDASIATLIKHSTDSHNQILCYAAST